jgi:hypothetical protein
MWAFEHVQIVVWKIGQAADQSLWTGACALQNRKRKEKKKKRKRTT